MMFGERVFDRVRDEVIRRRGREASQPAIESITSPAITDSAAPTRSAASRPARAWARTAAQAASKGSRPRASSAATMPESTSPVPAVASAGAESTLTARRSPSVTIVSSPLRTTTAPAARGGRAGAGDAVGGDLLRLAPEQAAELAGVRASAPSAPRRAAISSIRPAKALRPSASSTSGVSMPGTTSRASSSEPGSRPRPGPNTPAAAGSKALSTAFADPGARQPSPPGQPTDITSGWAISKTCSRSAGTATVA